MKSSSRTRNSFYNVIASTSANFIAIVIGIVSRIFFVKILGNEYLGLNGLFTNIISLLSIVELGIGSAIIYNLYKPIADNDQEKIKSLMKFYKKSYHIIGLIVCAVGLLLIPVLPLITGKVELNININLIYLLFLADSVLSYFLSYKRSILYAKQQNYIVQIIHIGYLFVMNFLQILFLYITKDFYTYLLIKVIMRIIENLIITLIVNKMYSYINDKNIKKLDKETEKDIFTKIKALFFHQIGAFIVNSTDNIIISRFLGIVVVGLYSNYYLIINSVQIVAKQIIDATTPSVGNLLVTESKEKQYDVFKKMRFLNFWIATFCSICLYVLLEPFVKIWLGKEYLLSSIVVLVLIFNFYQKTSRLTYSTFKTAAGIFYEDRFVPIIESLLNIIVSVVLVIKIGLVGVFIGTIVSGLTLWCYSYPKYVYKKLFNRSYFKYFIETIGYILLFLGILIVTILVTSFINLDNTYLELLIKLSICLIVPNILMIIIFFKTNNFRYLVGLMKKMISKIFKKKSNKDKVEKNNKNKYGIFNPDTGLEYASTIFDYNSFDSDNINNYLDDLDRVKMKIRFDNSVIKDIDFNKCPYEISNIILDESKVYNFEFNNDHLLRNNKYPKQIANNYELMKYILDYDYNYLAYIDPEVMDNDILIDIINYAFTKVYYLKVKNNEIDFDINNLFKKSKIIKHSYFKECYSYIDKMKGSKKK